MCVTRPVGSPPLKISAGLTFPQPVPCTNSPAGRPRTATAELAAPFEHPAAAAVAARATIQAAMPRLHTGPNLSVENIAAASACATAQCSGLSYSLTFQRGSWVTEHI